MSWTLTQQRRRPCSSSSSKWTHHAAAILLFVSTCLATINYPNNNDCSRLWLKGYKFSSSSPPNSNNGPPPPPVLKTFSNLFEVGQCETECASTIGCSAFAVGTSASTNGTCELSKAPTPPSRSSRNLHHQNATTTDPEAAPTGDCLVRREPEYDVYVIHDLDSCRKKRDPLFQQTYPASINSPSSTNVPIDCFYRLMSGRRLAKPHALKSLSVPSLQECQEGCIHEKSFQCRSISYRYMPSGYSYSVSNCELSPFYIQQQQQQQHQQQHDFIDDFDYDFFQREPYCKTNNNQQHNTFGVCAVVVRRGGRLTLSLSRQPPSSLVMVSTAQQCEHLCTTSLFRCRAFAFRHTERGRYASAAAAAVNTRVGDEKCHLYETDLGRLPSYNVEADPDFDLYEMGRLMNGKCMLEQQRGGGGGNNLLFNYDRYPPVTSTIRPPPFHDPFSMGGSRYQPPVHGGYYPPTTARDPPAYYPQRDYYDNMRPQDRQDYYGHGQGGGVGSSKFDHHGGGGSSSVGGNYPHVTGTSTIGNGGGGGNPPPSSSSSGGGHKTWEQSSSSSGGGGAGAHHYPPQGIEDHGQQYPPRQRPGTGDSPHNNYPPRRPPPPSSSQQDFFTGGGHSGGGSSSSTGQHYAPPQADQQRPPLYDRAPYPRPGPASFDDDDGTRPPPSPPSGDFPPHHLPAPPPAGGVGDSTNPLRPSEPPVSFMDPASGSGGGAGAGGAYPPHPPSPHDEKGVTTSDKDFYDPKLEVCLRVLRQDAWLVPEVSRATFPVKTLEECRVECLRAVDVLRFPCRVMAYHHTSSSGGTCQLSDTDMRDLRETDYMTSARSSSSDRYSSSGGGTTLFYDEGNHLCPVHRSSTTQYPHHQTTGGRYPPGSDYYYPPTGSTTFHSSSSSSSGYYPPRHGGGGYPPPLPPYESSRGYNDNGAGGGYYDGGQMQRPSDFYNNKFNRGQGGYPPPTTSSSGGYYDYQHGASGGSSAMMTTTVDGERCLHSCVRNQDAGFYYCQIDREGAWNFCCRPDEGGECGYSRGLSFSWCYVGTGPSRNIWRTCNYRGIQASSSGRYPSSTTTSGGGWSSSSSLGGTYAPPYNSRHPQVSYLHDRGPPTVQKIAVAELANLTRDDALVLFKENAASSSPANSGDDVIIDDTVVINNVLLNDNNSTTTTTNSTNNNNKKEKRSWS